MHFSPEHPNYNIEQQNSFDSIKNYLDEDIYLLGYRFRGVPDSDGAVTLLPVEDWWEE
jgi:hypothetical protein